MFGSRVLRQLTGTTENQQCSLGIPQNGIGWITDRSAWFDVSRWQTGEQFQSLHDVLHGINRKQTFFNSFDDFVIQHQMLPVMIRNQDTLFTIQADFLTQIEVALNLVIDSTNRQYFAILIQCACYRDALI